MDPLSDVLALLKPQGYLTAGLDAGGAWAMRFASHAGTIKCHAVTRGSCWLSIDGGKAVRLAAGDCVVFPGGHAFMLASDLAATPVAAADLLGRAQPGETVVHQGGSDFSLIGTRFDVDGRKAAALLGALPACVHLQGPEDQDVLRWCIAQMMAEMQGSAPGSGLAAHHLAHLMLMQAFRLYLAQAGTERVGMLYALSDPQLARAIEAMHGEPAYRWTLGELSRRAGLSRSGFAQRFRDRVGESPMAYLTRWRMLLAADQLGSSRTPLAEVANSLGYDSPNAFNTAFRRVMGASPRRYAELERALSG